MKITFFSNFLTHHQLPFCNIMFSKFKDNYTFVATKGIFDERIKLGFENLDFKYKFVLRAYENEENYKKAILLAEESDVVIMGAAPEEFIEERLKEDKLTFRYCERVFLFGYDGKNDELKNIETYNKHIKYKNNSNYYVLCASAYGEKDFNEIGAYKDKMFRWGYFPETKHYNIDELIEDKERNDTIDILWAGRFISFKHPEIVIDVAKKLKAEKYKFKIKMLGNGVLEENIKSKIEREGLSNEIEILGAVAQQKVRSYMEKANIVLFTSDRDEGWGVISNEAMNSGCVLIANNDIGSVPFLVNDGDNGFVYNDFDELYKKIKMTIENKELRYNIGKSAYNTIINTWNAENATQNFIELFRNILDKKKEFLKEGPTSKI